MTDQHGASGDPAKTEDEQDKPLGRDERVSLWPLSFEEVVRRVHAAPRSARPKKPGKKRAG